MKTKWGTCNVEARCIWLNLELVRKPVHCLEYIIRPRTGASAGAESQRPLRRVDGSVPAIMAAVPRRAEPFAAGTWGVGVLVGARGSGGG